MRAVGVHIIATRGEGKEGRAGQGEQTASRATQEAVVILGGGHGFYLCQHKTLCLHCWEKKKKRKIHKGINE